MDLGARKPGRCWRRWRSGWGARSHPDSLVDLVWGEDPPRGARDVALLPLRRTTGAGAGPRSAQKPTVLLTSDHGYRLDLRAQRVNAHRFADEVNASRRAWRRSSSSSRPAPGPTGRTGPASPTTSTGSRSLLGLWSGEAYADLPDHPEVALERASLDQLRRGAEEDRVLGLLALGDHAVVVAATEQATARYPLQERVWALHALALARSGRQAESLAALRQIRRVLADELGLDPGPGAARPRAGGPRPGLRAPGVVATGMAATARARTPRLPPGATATRWGTVGRERRGGGPRGGARPGERR